MTLIKQILRAVFMCFISMSTAYSQNPEKLAFIEKEIKKGNNEIALQKLSEIDTGKISKTEAAFYYYLSGKANANLNNEAKAYKKYLKSKQYYLSIDSIDKAMDINLNLGYIIHAQKNSHSNYKKYYNEYIAYAIKGKDSLKLLKAFTQLASIKINDEEKEESLEYFKKALSLNKKIGNKEIQSTLNTNIAVLYNELLNKPDSALYYLKNDLPYLKQAGIQEDICYNYINQASSYYYLGNYKKAIELLHLADNIPIKNHIKNTKSYIYEFLSINEAAAGNYKNAYENLLLNKTYQDSVNIENQNIAIADIQIKYETEKKEIENNNLKNNIKTNRYLLYTFIGLLIASIIIGYLIIKNLNRKQKIIRQEKQIQMQKLEKALKEQELNSIDMILEGQEKERQRLANDLHDNLGSMLATLKLNFEHLKIRQTELKDEENKIYQRTDELIEEAYQKVRRLAHAKNAGVIANEGLIPAIKNMAEKISIPNKLQIHVVAFGFTNRLENTLEITIFRMIQELATNIIKHSKATEATIHLTNHDQNINIIIEDNGIGFNTKEIKANAGMGLHNITRKTEQLGGTFTIDTTPNKGTTIIIDIPHD